MELRFQLQEVHLRNVRVIVIQRLLELFVGLVHLLLSIGRNPLHFLCKEVVVVIRLKFDVLLVDLAFNGVLLLLDIRLQSLFPRAILSKVQRLNKLALDAPERAHLRKVIDIDSIAPVVYGFLQARCGPNHHRDIECREDYLGSERGKLFLLGLHTESGFGKLGIIGKPLFHKAHTVIADLSRKSKGRHQKDCHDAEHNINLAKT